MGILVFGLLSPLAHGDSLARLGIRLDTFGACARQVLVPTVVAILAFVVVGVVTGSWRSPDWSRAPAGILRYTGWALLQQGALQDLVLLRLKDAGMTRRAPIAAAALFALMHLPNPGLMLLTFAGGWIWCRAFDRAPNLLAIAISHALAALAADQSLPDTFIRGLRVGPGYFRHLS
jgi:Type II CAAX prenyl endopeptidase Rce1-like